MADLKENNNDEPFTFSSASDLDSLDPDQALRAKQAEEVEDEKAKALKRRKTLQTYVLLAQM
jgi:uridylate kinase